MEPTPERGYSPVYRTLGVTCVLGLIRSNRIDIWTVKLRQENVNEGKTKMAALKHRLLTISIVIGQTHLYP